MRLACVKHAASVRSEPGSNSQVHHIPQTPPAQPVDKPPAKTNRTRETSELKPNHAQPTQAKPLQTINTQYPGNTHPKIPQANAPVIAQPAISKTKSNHKHRPNPAKPNHQPNHMPPHNTHMPCKQQDAANVSLPKPDAKINEQPPEGGKSGRTTRVR